MVTNAEKDKSAFVYVKDTTTGRVRRVAVPVDFQVGFTNSPAMLELFGGLSLNVKDVKTTNLSNAIYAATNNDTVISVTKNSVFTGAITIVLPSNPKQGQVHFIKDASGTASANNIILTSTNFIDGATTQTISSVYGTLAVYFQGAEWHVFASGSGSGSGGSGDTGTSYVVLNATSSLANERVLTAGTNVSLVDSGPGGTITINATGGSSDSGAQYLTLANTASLSAERMFSASIGLTPNDGGSNNTYSLRVDNNVIDTTASMIVIAAELDAISDELELLSGTLTGSFGDPHAQYLTLATSTNLSSERVFNPSTGLTAVDGGANSNYTLSINNNVVATVSGTRFTGPVSASAGLSGSLQQVASNLSYLVAGSNITITSQSNGQIVIASTASGSVGGSSPTSEFWSPPAIAHASDIEGTDAFLPAGWGFYRYNGSAFVSVSPVGTVDFESSPASATFRASYNVRKSWISVQPSLDYSYLYLARRVSSAPNQARFSARMSMASGYQSNGSGVIALHLTPDGTTVPSGFASGNWIGAGWNSVGARLTVAYGQTYNGGGETTVQTPSIDAGYLSNSEFIAFINSSSPNGASSHRLYIRSDTACRQFQQFSHGTFTNSYWVGILMLTTNNSNVEMPFAPIFNIDYVRQVDDFTSFIP